MKNGCEICGGEATHIGNYHLCPLHSQKLDRLGKAMDIVKRERVEFRNLFKAKGYHRWG